MPDVYQINGDASECTRPTRFFGCRHSQPWSCKMAIVSHTVRSPNGKSGLMSNTLKGSSKIQAERSFCKPSSVRCHPTPAPAPSRACCSAHPAPSKARMARRYGPRPSSTSKWPPRPGNAPRSTKSAKTSDLDWSTPSSSLVTLAMERRTHPCVRQAKTDACKLCTSRHKSHNTAQGCTMRCTPQAARSTRPASSAPTLR